MNKQYIQYNLKTKEKHVHQGDIYKEIDILIYNAEGELLEVTFPYVIVASQECDLSQDYDNRCDLNTEKHDKYIPSIIVVAAYLKELFKKGDHLRDINQTMEDHNSARMKLIEQNNNFRYQFLSGCSDYQIPELVVDFKHYYTISRDYFCSKFLDENHYLASLNSIYREHFSSRFGHYLCRIALP
jgi:hypothetical protein